MKNLLFFLLFLGIATSFFYCSKRAGDSTTSSGIAKLPADNRMNQLVAGDDGGGSPNCNCGPGYASCWADCLFSDCCICWDARKSEGSCGCYFGIAKCKTALIGKNSVETGPHSIKVYHFRFNEYLKFLKRLPSDLYPLEEAYKKLIKYSTPYKNSKGEVGLADGNIYDTFYKVYTEYINTLSKKDQSLVLEYINYRTNKK